MSYITVVRPISNFCGKTFELVNNKIVKKPTAAPAKSEAFTIECNDLKQLAHIINNLKQGMAIILGYIPETTGVISYHMWSVSALKKAGYYDQNIVLDQALRSDLIIEDGDEIYAPRLKNLFTQAPFFCLDRDFDEDAPDAIMDVQKLSNSDFHELFSSGINNEVSQAFHGAGFISVPSASNQVFLKDGTAYSEYPSSHLYFQVADPNDLERFAVALRAQVAANGYAYAAEKQLNGGKKAIYQKTIFDPSVFTLGRLFFESSPRVIGDLELKKEQAKYIKWNDSLVDTFAVESTNEQTDTYLRNIGMSFHGDHLSSDTLTPEMVITTRDYGDITVQHYMDHIDRKIRCQTPFRESESWAAYLNRHEDGSVFLYDSGTLTKYNIPEDLSMVDKFFANMVTSANARREMDRLADEIEQLDSVADAKDFDIFSFKNLEEEAGQNIENIVDDIADIYDDDCEIMEEIDHSGAVVVSANNDSNDDEYNLKTPAPKHSREIECWTFGDMLKLDLPTKEQLTLWGDASFIRSGLTFFAGAPKVGKSGFVLEMAVAAATGREWFDCPFSRPLKVMWLQAELLPTFSRDRTLALTEDLNEKELGLLCENLCITNRADFRINTRDRAMFERLVKKFKPEILIIDPMRNLIEIKNEADPTEVSEAIRLVRQTIAKGNPDCMPLIVHHTRKLGAGKDSQTADIFDTMSGSGAMRGLYDCGLLLVADPQNRDDKYLFWEARNGASPKPMELYQDGFRLVRGDRTTAGMKEPANKKDAMIIHEVVIEYLKKNKAIGLGSALAFSDIAQSIRLELDGLHRLDVNERTILRHIQQMNDVQIEKKGKKNLVYFSKVKPHLVSEK